MAKLISDVKAVSLKILHAFEIDTCYQTKYLDIVKTKGCNHARHILNVICIYNNDSFLDPRQFKISRVSTTYIFMETFFFRIASSTSH